MTLCVYPDACLGGLASAWAIWSSETNRRRRWRFHPARYDHVPNLRARTGADAELARSIEEAGEVLFAGFVYPEHVMYDLLERGSIVSMIVHRESQYEEMRSLRSRFRFVQFDPARSAGVQIWHLMHPAEPPPALFAYVDAYTRADPSAAPKDAPDIILTLRSWPMRPKSLDTADMDALLTQWRRFAAAPEELRRDGTALLRYYQERVAEYASEATVWTFPDSFLFKEALLTNCPQDVAGDVGQAILSGLEHPTICTAGTWVMSKSHTMHVCLQSKGGSALAIAKAYDGNGHSDSAALCVSADAVNFSERIIYLA